MPLNTKISAQRIVCYACSTVLCGSGVTNISLAAAPHSLTRDTSTISDINDHEISHAKAAALIKRLPVDKQPQSKPAGEQDTNSSSIESSPDPKGNAEPADRPAKESEFAPGPQEIPVEPVKKPAVSPNSKVEFGEVSQSGRNGAADPDSWSRLYESGLKELREKRFEIAQDRLNSALKIARLGMGDDRKLLLTRVALAQVLLEQKKYNDAGKLFDSCQSTAKKMQMDSELATCKQGLAEIALYYGRNQQAEVLAKDAYVLRNKVSGPSAQTANCLVLRGMTLSKNNWVNEAEDSIISGISMMENARDKSLPDLAEALRQAGVMFHEHGKSQEAEEFFDRSYRLLEEQARLNLPPELVGQLNFRWEQGSPRSLEIPDSDFPLKYLQLNHVRVAATVIDLWELYGVLISITNVGSERVSIGLGKPMLYNTTSGGSPTLTKLQLIDPASIDRIRRERNMWDLTQNRPWLANMQKTRSQRGFVPPKGHDLFRGPNVFGVYGEWNALPRELPDKLMLQPSPERVLYQAQTAIDPGLIKSSTIKIRNLFAVTLEPFESRTGEIFFLNPRCEKLLLSVPVGNVNYQIPFSARRKRIK